MAKHHDQKTNALREIEAAGIEHRAIPYDGDVAIAGTEVAALLGEDPDQVFKTLVTVGKTGEHYVFMVPVACELDLKKAASCVGEKSIAMIKARELLPLTGYIHGGCSPVGMKTHFRTIADETAELYPTILFSGGRIGLQVQMDPHDLQTLVGLEFADITA